LIGTIQSHADAHNRWGYIEEEIRGAEARMLGVMRVDEESIDRRRRTSADSHRSHPFKVIRATGTRPAHARVASIQRPVDYTFHDKDVSRSRERVAGGGGLRVMSCRPGRAGFLAALADTMRTRRRERLRLLLRRLYDLRQTHSARAN